MGKSKKIILTGYRDLKQKISSESSQSLRESLKQFGDDLEFGYKYAPDLEKDPTTMFAAKAIIAAEHQDMGEDVYQNVTGGKNFTREGVFELVKKLGLDMKRFETDFNDETTEKRVYEDIAAAKNSGLHVFPGLTIDGMPYKGAWDDNSLFSAIRKRGAKQARIAMDSFFEWGAAAAIVLIIATAGALLLVNLGYSELYEHWRHTELGFSFGGSRFTLPVEIWINDFLMAIFFLLIGLEIKREVLDGELSDAKSAAMPVIGAIGGMVIPALIYIAVNLGSSTANGWGIPMATDIAFTLGLMALLGTRAPLSLKIFISALAVADDLGAIIVIALFYGHGFHIWPFVGALLVIGLMFFLNRKKVFNIAIYVVLGLILWFLIFKSGLHATLAGVITAILIPVRGKADLSLIAQQTSIIFNREIGKSDNQNQSKISHGSLEVLKNAIERLREPSEYLMHSLEKVVNYSILPLFAFFNTGILISGGSFNLMEPVNLGILLGLCLGKPLGIVGACWIASKAKIAQLSSEISWKALLGGACLAGVGFTMSIVVASSAFKDNLLTSAKISILLASTLSAVIGLLILRFSSKK